MTIEVIRRVDMSAAIGAPLSDSALWNKVHEIAFELQDEGSGLFSADASDLEAAADRILALATRLHHIVERKIAADRIETDG